MILRTTLPLCVLRAFFSSNDRELRAVNKLTWHPPQGANLVLPSRFSKMTVCTIPCSAFVNRSAFINGTTAEAIRTERHHVRLASAELLFVDCGTSWNFRFCDRSSVGHADVQYLRACVRGRANTEVHTQPEQMIHPHRARTEVWQRRCNEG